MRQLTAAVLSRALGMASSLFSSPRGRHASATGRRRRRSTRVRRYAPVPTPAQVSAAPERPQRPAHAPRMAPPSERFQADDIALVRPYYAAHERAPGKRPRSQTPVSGPSERELARIQAEATARLHGWATRGTRPQPCGGLLVPEPVSAPTSGAVSGLASATATVPPPRPAPESASPEDWRTFTRLTRIWLDQRQGAAA